ncbi:hypothetical protein GOBAR_DD34173 [Gossypium barbadense]|nr:hypothetical protein GOBAR_DD34173 [Gossypium barbadense]
MDRIRAFLVAVAVVAICGVPQVRSTASDHRYKAGDEVPLYANKVGPYHNPSETYRYFDFPFCSSAPVKEKKEALGEVLNGDRLVSAPYKLEFLTEKEAEIACKRKLTKEEVVKFRKAVSKDYYFQMYYDDLPIWGFLGKVEKEGKTDPADYKYYLFKHLVFEIHHNKDRVIEITVRSDPNALVDLTEDVPVDVDFMYTVKWKETNTPFEKRMDKYSLSSSLPHHLEIHWFSIINSCVTDSHFPPFFMTATAALPFGTIVVIFLIWALVTSPLLVLGGIAGKNSKAEFQAPCRTTKYPREIPPLPWYRKTIPQMAMAGFLPFSAIYIELYYIFASVWGHRIYTIYSILFIVFIILLIVTAFITVALTYFQLAAEDHEWWWRSFLCGGSTGLFIYTYCLYYYNARSDMSGFMQTSFFFGYMACICYGFFLMLGAIGFRASLLFVRHIYRSIKCE